jgi:hypothetical protein
MVNPTMFRMLFRGEVAEYIEEAIDVDQDVSPFYQQDDVCAILVYPAAT